MHRAQIARDQGGVVRMERAGDPLQRRTPALERERRAVDGVDRPEIRRSSVGRPRDSRLAPILAQLAARIAYAPRSNTTIFA